MVVTEELYGHERIKVILVGRTWGCKGYLPEKRAEDEVRDGDHHIPPGNGQNAIEEAAAILRRGGLLGIPTETVYGLGADGLNEDAVRRIFEAKGRQQDNPLILHMPDAGWLERCCADIPGHGLCAGGTVLARAADHDPARRDCVPLHHRRAGYRGRPLPRPSGDAGHYRGSGYAGGRAQRQYVRRPPSPTCARHMMEDMMGKIDGIVDGGPCAVGGGEHHHRSDGAAARLLRARRTAAGGTGGGAGGGGRG